MFDFEIVAAHDQGCANCGEAAVTGTPILILGWGMTFPSGRVCLCWGCVMDLPARMAEIRQSYANAWEAYEEPQRFNAERGSDGN